MAWATSTRRGRLPKDWPARRRRVLERDRYQCQHVREDTGRICALPATDVDHRTPGDDHSDANLRSLCGWHHDQKSSREGAAAAERNRKAAVPAFTDHPGFTAPT